MQDQKSNQGRIDIDKQHRQDGVNEIFPGNASNTESNDELITEHIGERASGRIGSL